MTDEDLKMKLQSDELKRVTWVGLAANILLSIFKVFAGLVGSSQAVVADGVHSISDTSTDIALLIGVNYWSAPPDREHPHGHRRIETAVTAFIGLVLFGVAFGLSYNAIVTLGVNHAHPPGLIALIAALVSIAVKEALYQWNVFVGKKINSSALVANAWHHRSDALSSIPAALAVGGAKLFPQWYFLDHIGAILVSVLIMFAALKIVWPAVQELTDWGGSPDICERIEKLAESTDGVMLVHKCRTRRLGYGLQVDLHIQVEPGLSVREGHDISEAVKKRLIEQGPSVVDVITHLEPFEEQ